eukprot:GHVU01214869.1.p1 GENE.GHVU01214869.1~~GHVU01214869.1.p1  ORF type:complete len:111 (-),score=5.73 GHVU01214869.1:41-373(-)
MTSTEISRHGSDSHRGRAFAEIYVMEPPSHDTVAADDDPSMYPDEFLNLPSLLPLPSGGVYLSSPSGVAADSGALLGLTVSGVFQLRAASPVCVVECAEGSPSWPIEEVD